MVIQRCLTTETYTFPLDFQVLIIQGNLVYLNTCVLLTTNFLLFICQVYCANQLHSWICTNILIINILVPNQSTYLGRINLVNYLCVVMAKKKLKILRDSNIEHCHNSMLQYVTEEYNGKILLYDFNLYPNITKCTITRFRFRFS